MKPITNTNYSIYFNTEGYSILNQHLNNTNYSKIFVIVDTNTHDYCLPYFLAQIETNITIEIIEIEAGEHHKTIETCTGVWQALSDLEGDRKSIVINLGGGVVTDLGGFVASTFRRGIDFINIPTTLLAMVDASVGGKTGVDLNHLKNQIGVINTPKLIVIDTKYLSSLPSREIRSGYAEMLKHGLITNTNIWNKLKATNKINFEALDELIHESISIKNNIVTQDPTEQNIRKHLNFGHTLGHAIESYYLENTEREHLLHGEAIAIGMVLAAHLSKSVLKLTDNELNDIKSSIINIYGQDNIPEADYNPIIDLLKFDKKNEHGKIKFVLLESIGTPKFNIEVSNQHIIDALNFYNN